MLGASNEMDISVSPFGLQIIIVDYLFELRVLGNKRLDTAFICKIMTIQNLPNIVFCLPFSCSRGRCQRMTVLMFTFPKSRLLATFNCKMVAIEKIQSPKKRKTLKGRTLHDILYEGLMRQTSQF